MYFAIAVTAAKDPKKNVFTYFSDKSLAAGTFVTVPFGKKRSQGVVIAKQDTADVPGILPVLRVLLPFPIFTQTQLTLCTWLANYYAASLSATLALALPDIPPKLLQTAPQPTAKLNQPQSLILVPSLHYLQIIAQKYREQARAKPLLLYHGDQTPKERAATYLAVRAGTGATIIATRSGVFLPFQKLQSITQFAEHDWGYKETRTPAYHTTIVAQQLATLLQIPFQIKDNSPRIQTFAASQPQHITISPIMDLQKKPELYSIALQNEVKKGNQSLISETLAALLKSTLHNRGTVLLYINKRNDGGMLHCQHCKAQQYMPEKPPLCPACKSSDITFSVVNLKQAAADVNRLLRLWGMPAGKWQATKAGSAVVYLIQSEPVITIATQKIFYTAPFRSFSLVAALLCDTLFNLPEFRAAEKAFATLCDLAMLTKANGTFVLQTRHIDHPVLQAFRAHDYAAFAAEELAERKPTGYPPFTVLVLLKFAAKTAATVSQHTTALLSALSAVADAQATDDVEVIGPIETLRNPLQARILLKGRNRAALSPFLAAVPANWKLDFDPENITT